MWLKYWNLSTPLGIKHKIGVYLYVERGGEYGIRACTRWISAQNTHENANEYRCVAEIDGKEEVITIPAGSKISPQIPTRANRRLMTVPKAVADAYERMHACKPTEFDEEIIRTWATHEASRLSDTAWKRRTD